jgi:hypothetical protein
MRSLTSVAIPSAIARTTSRASSRFEAMNGNQFTRFGPAPTPFERASRAANHTRDSAEGGSVL